MQTQSEADASSSVETTRRKRTLDDKACEVCEDKSTGKHYGAYVCDGCCGFFKRTVRRSIPWVCRNDGKCIVDRASRTECRACRFKKCLMVNMNPEGVQVPRGARTSHHNQNTGNVSGDWSNSILTNTSPNYDQSGTTGQKVTNSLSPDSSVSPPITTAGVVSVTEFQNEPESPVFIKVEGEQIDGRDKSVVNPSEVIDIVESRSEGPVLSPTLEASLAQKGSLCLPFISGGIRPPRDAPEQRFLSPMLVVPNSRFPPYPYPSPRFQSATPRYSVAGHTRDIAAALSRAQGCNDSLHHMAINLLSSSVKFAKNVASFKSLPFRDQVILLEESWKDLFVLDAAVWSFPLETSFVFSTVEKAKEASASLVSSLKLLQELVTRIQALGLDETECAFLKTIVIFKPDIKGLKDSQQIENIQDDAQVKLSEYIERKDVENRARFGRLLLSLTAFERVSQDTVEKLFFRAENDSPTPESILHDLLKKT